MTKLPGDQARASKKSRTPSRDETPVGPNTSVTVDSLVQSLLRLDPAVLAGFGGLDPEIERAQHQGATSRRGLNRFLRWVLALAEVLANDESAAIHLKTEAAARLNGWPDARTANTAMMLAWALVEDERLIKGLPSVPLLVADPEGDQLLDPGPAGVTDADLPSAAVLVARRTYELVLTPEMVARRERILAGALSPVVGTRVASPNQLVRDILGLEPQRLASVLDPHGRWPEYSYAVVPEEAGRAGLLRLLQDTFDQYRAMREREVDEIRLMTEADAKTARRPDAHSANLATLLSAGLLSEDGHEPTFEAARPVSPAEAELRKAIAKHVYFEGSTQSLQGFKLICDSNVHFGVYHGFSQATRLLQQVRKEHDPSDDRYEQLPSGVGIDLMFMNLAEEITPED